MNKKQKNALLKEAKQKRATRNLSAGLSPGTNPGNKPTKPKKLSPKERREAENRGKRQAENSPAGREPLHPDEPIRARKRAGNLGKKNPAFENKEAEVAAEEHQAQERKRRRKRRRNKEREEKNGELTPGGRGFNFGHGSTKA